MDMEIMNVSKFWEVNPQSVEIWNYTDFLNRQEYMYLFSEIDRLNTDTDTDTDTDAGVPWAGPDS
jgi:hypothetical protein